MILDKKDLLYYLQEDRRAMGITKRKRPKYNDEIWKFAIILRKHEYYSNIKRTLYSTIMKKMYGFLHVKKGFKLGFDIPINVFGSGLRINHFGLIIVNPNARVGINCDIHQGVNIGQNLKYGDVPVLGDNIWIGPGAKIFGKISIANNIAIGANSVVNKSFDEENITIAGTPSKKIRNNGTKKMAMMGNII